MTHSKKYYSITEVAEQTGLSDHKLRYIEKCNPTIPIIRIRNRRYYTLESIEYIKALYCITSNKNKLFEAKKRKIVKKIDKLINKFKEVT